MCMLVTHEIMHYIGWIIRINVKNKKLSDIFHACFLDCISVQKLNVHFISDLGHSNTSLSRHHPNIVYGISGASRDNVLGPKALFASTRL
jgi:hypothetical protein